MIVMDADIFVRKKDLTEVFAIIVMIEIAQWIHLNQNVIMNNYPLGARNNSNAPYNELPKSEQEFEVTMYQTLIRTEQVKTDDYELDGDYFNTDNTDWTKAFTLNRHYTALDLIKMFQKYLENNNGSKHLINECKSFSEELIEYEAR